MDTCALGNCGADAIDECEMCSACFCGKHGNKAEHVCVNCMKKEEERQADELF